MKQPASVIGDWLTRIREEGKGLTPWEENFIEDLTSQFEETQSISDRQEEILERIYAQKTP
jgi:hypothetical protein